MRADPMTSQQRCHANRQAAQGLYSVSQHSLRHRVSFLCAEGDDKC